MAMATATATATEDEAKLTEEDLGKLGDVVDSTVVGFLEEDGDLGGPFGGHFGGRGAPGIPWIQVSPHCRQQPWCAGHFSASAAHRSVDDGREYGRPMCSHG